LLGSLSDYKNSLTALGCDGDLISEKWIANHARWIVWKLAATERKFATLLGGKYLNYNRVVQQLLHRYSKEIKGGSRPAIRRILNRDVSSNCMMILCVARIQHEVSREENDGGVDSESSKDSIAVEFTDGWYSLPAVLDDKLCEFVGNGTIRTGTKLLVSNSILTGFDDGVDPLDVSYDPFKPGCSPVLHIAANSTRLAAWNAKLGFVQPSARLVSQEGLLLVRKVSDIIEGGGRIPLIHLRVVAKHPLMYLERSSDGSKGRVLTEGEENARIEEEEKQRQRLIEQFSDEVQAECIKVSFPKKRDG